MALLNLHYAIITKHKEIKMQVTLEIRESAFEQVMYLLKNLADIEVISKTSKSLPSVNSDEYFLQEKARLQKSKEQIDDGSVAVLSEEMADKQIDAFLAQL